MTMREQWVNEMMRVYVRVYAQESANSHWNKLGGKYLMDMSENLGRSWVGGIMAGTAGVHRGCSNWVRQA